MNRKDSEKDSDRPHYYSQFWLDVAAGRRIIGQPKPSDDAELSSTEASESEPMEPAPQNNIRHIQRDSAFTAASDGHAGTIIHPVAEPAASPEEYIEPEAEEEPDYAMDEVDDLDLPEVDEADIPDMDLGPIDTEDEESEEEDFLDEEEEEEEEDLDWSGRGRKKPKPARATKLPKKPRRDPRRSF
jgi:hypothetical protein